MSYKTPVACLLLALYRHPFSEYLWERHCTDNLRLAGLKPAPKWESMLTHCDLQTVLSVYFDDVKMAGPEANMNKAWALVRSGISTDEPAPLG